jgi:hypothetical protein
MRGGTGGAGRAGVLADGGCVRGRVPGLRARRAARGAATAMAGEWRRGVRARGSVGDVLCGGGGACWRRRAWRPCGARRRACGVARGLPLDSLRASRTGAGRPPVRGGAAGCGGSLVRGGRCVGGGRRVRVRGRRWRAAGAAGGRAACAVSRALRGAYRCGGRAEPGWKVLGGLAAVLAAGARAARFAAAAGAGERRLRAGGGAMAWGACAGVRLGPWRWARARRGDRRSARRAVARRCLRGACVAAGRAARRGAGRVPSGRSAKCAAGRAAVRERAWAARRAWRRAGGRAARESGGQACGAGGGAAGLAARGSALARRRAAVGRAVRGVRSSGMKCGALCGRGDAASALRAIAERRARAAGGCGAGVRACAAAGVRGAGQVAGPGGAGARCERARLAVRAGLRRGVLCRRRRRLPAHAVRRGRAAANARGWRRACGGRRAECGAR